MPTPRSPGVGEGPSGAGVGGSAEVAHHSYTYGAESAATPAIPIDDVKRVANGPFPSSEFQSVGAVPSGPPFRLGLFGATIAPEYGGGNPHHRA